MNIDPSLEHIPQLAEALDVDLSSVMGKLLTTLKMELNQEVKNASPEKQQLLLEYLFPYAVLDGYSELVTFLLKMDAKIPEVVVEKLLNEPNKYEKFLTPPTLMNIYRQHDVYFEDSVCKSVHSKPQKSLSFETISCRCPINGRDKFKEFFLQSPS